MSDFVTSRGLPTSVLFAVCLAVVGLPVAEADPLRKGYLLQYQEEFNEEALNTEDWYYRDMNTERLGGYNKKEAVSVVTEGGIGMLKIAYYEEDMNGDTSPDPVGGGIISRTTFGYGYYEARIKFYDGARGLHQSFWTAGTGNWSTYDWQVNEDARNDLIPWNNSSLEIDGIELDSNYNHGSANYHWWLPEHSNPANAHKSFSATYIDKTDWITVGFEWLPGRVVYYVNGVERHRVSYTDTLQRVGPKEVWITALANTASFFGGGGSPGPGAAMRVDYFRFYTKPVQGNYVANAGFEAQGSASTQAAGWISVDGVSDNIHTDQLEVPYDDGNAYSGLGYLHLFGEDEAGPMTAQMRLDHLPKGNYRLSAWVKSSGGMTQCRMRAWSHGGVEQTVDIPTTPEWTQITLDAIEVTSNRVDLGFTTEGPAGTWLYVDDVVFTPVAQEEETGILIDNGDPGYVENGAWSDSSLSGVNGSSTRYSSADGAYAQWTPDIPAYGDYHVYIYRVVHAGSDPAAQIRVSHANGQNTQINDFSSGSSGWFYLGTYPFQAGTAGFVRNTRGSDNARADAVILFPAAAGGEVQLSGIYPDGPNMVLPAHGLRLDKQYVLTFASSLEAGFNTVVDGPRSPDVDSDPSRDTFSDARPSGMPENGFYRLEELP